MKIFCPKHKNEQLKVLRYTILEKTGKTGRYRQGRTVKLDWMLCEKCDKPYLPKVVFT